MQSEHTGPNVIVRCLGSLAAGLVAYALVQGMYAWLSTGYLSAGYLLTAMRTIRLEAVAGAVMVAFITYGWLEHRIARRLRRELSDQISEAANLSAEIQELTEALEQTTEELTGAQESTRTLSEERQRKEATWQENERRTRAWLEQASDGIFVADAEGCLIEFNGRLCELVGTPRDQLDRETALARLFGASAGAYMEFLSLLKTDGAAACTLTPHRPDDTWIHVEVDAHQIEDGHILGVVRDITARQRADEALKERELWYRTLFELASDAMFLMDGDQFIDCNEATLRMFRCEREQIVGQPPYHFSPPQQPDGQESRTKAREYIRKALSGERQFFEWLHSRHDGTLFHAEVGLNNLRVKGRNYLLAMVRDVTERHRMEASLRESELRSRAVVQVSRDAIVAIDAEGYISVFNPAAEELFGRSAADMIGAKLEEIIPDSLRAEHEQGLRDHMENGAGLATAGTVREVVALRADGSRFPVEMTITACHDTPSMRLVATIRDNSGRPASASATPQLVELFGILTDHVTDLVAVLDSEARYTYVNPACSRLLGQRRDDLMGRCLLEFVHPDDLGVVMKTLSGVREQPDGEPAYFQVRHRQEDGGWRSLAVVCCRLPDEQGEVRMLLMGHNCPERRPSGETASTVPSSRPVGRQT